MWKSSLSFIGANIKILGELPAEIIPNHILRRCNSSEIAVIRERLSSFRGTDYMVAPSYELHLREVEGDGNEGKSFSVTQLPEESWRYYCIAIEESDANKMKERLESLLCLVEPTIWIGLSFYYSEPRQKGEIRGSGYSTYCYGLLANVFELFNSHTAVDVSEIKQVGCYYDALLSLRSNHGFIKKALRRYSDVCMIWPINDLVIVGLFSIIESLITHKPRLQESLDSISHQIRTKLQLLSRRFKSTADHSAYFKEVGTKTLWSKLYEYRSCIAHGDWPDFNKELRVLKSRDAVIAYLHCIVKQLLLTSLSEPDLVSDLRAC